MAHAEVPETPVNPDTVTRWNRIMDCVNLRQPDRMPTGFFATFWLAKYGGISNREIMYNTDLLEEITVRATEELQPDLFFPNVFNMSMGRVLEKSGYQQLEWPGNGVADNRPYQYIDKEYMSADEYDEFLFDPTGFYLSKYLPRVCKAYEGIESVASVTGNYYTNVAFASAAFVGPGLIQAATRLQETGQIVLEHVAANNRLVSRMAQLGFPSSIGAVSCAPYDVLADYFRGATGMMKDLFRKKDQLPEVLDKMATLVIRDTLRQASYSSNPIVFIPVHWAPDAFMSQKQFETFWWPSYKRLQDALIDNGLIPMPMWEADCTNRLEFLAANTPPGKCIYWFERTDMVKAFEMLGDIVALRGGMHPSLLINGTPQEVDAEMRHLAENVFAKGGKLILDGAFGLPDEATIENVRTMYAAALKYGA